MRRLFVAVDLDDRARSAVAGIISTLSEGLRHDRRAGRITWVREEHLHLTLRFLGDVEEARVPAIQEALSTPLTTVGFEVLLEGLGMFPPAGRARVVWLAVKNGGAELESLFREVEDRLHAAAVPREAPPFQAHLTLGRFRDATGRPDLEATGLGAVPVGPCRVNHVTLYESRLSGKGPTYAIVAQAMMAARR